MRIWIDLSAPAHPVFFRPLVRLLAESGITCEITARDYAQTLELCRLHRLDVTPIGAHGGASRVGKVSSLAGRSLALARWARGRAFDLAISHGSNDLPVVASLARIPVVDTWDYEFAVKQHTLGGLIAERVVVPESIPAARLDRLRIAPRKVRRYPGLKEEYYLYDFSPDDGILERLGADPGRVIVVMRAPPIVALYHRVENTLYPQLLERLGHDPGVHVIVLPRVATQEVELRARKLPSVIVPRTAIDGQSLVAASDLVISAGGTMNREAVALGVPAYTTFQGTMGGVDEWLIRERRMHQLTRIDDLRIEKRGTTSRVVGRDPQLLLDLLLDGARGKQPQSPQRPFGGGTSSAGL